MGNFIDITGKQFSRLTVLKRVSDGNSGESRWLCLCVCGTLKEILSSHIRSGRIVSCGCYNNELKVVQNKTHGLTTHNLYKRFQKIKERCYNKKSKYYKNYGGRGIKICNEWLNDFKSFYDWAIKNGYKKELTIDRIDNDGDYGPFNCQWVTNKINMQNQSKSRFWIVNGKKFNSSTEAAKHHNVGDETIRKWCLGYNCTIKGKVYNYKRRQNCYSIKKYRR